MSENRMRRGLVHSLTCTAIVQLTRVVCVVSWGQVGGVCVRLSGCFGPNILLFIRPFVVKRAINISPTKKYTRNVVQDVYPSTLSMPLHRYVVSLHPVIKELGLISQLFIMGV